MEMNMEMKKMEEKHQSMGEMLSKMMGMIHPDAERISLIGIALKNLAKAHEGLVVSDGLDEKLSLMRIDLYSLMKDIATEKEVPSAIVEATDYMLSMEVLTAYENPTKSKEISVEDMQKIVNTNEKSVKELKDGKDNSSN